MRIIGWTLVGLACLAFTLVSSPARPLTPELAGLAACALVLELLSPPLSLGFACLAGAPYVAAAALHPPFACLLALAAVLVRTLLRGQPRAALPSLVPVLATAVFCLLIGRWLSSPVWLALAALEVYLPLALLLPAQFQPRVQSERNPVVFFEVGAAFLAPGLVKLGALWLALPLLALNRAARQALRPPAHPLDEALTEQQLERAEVGLQQGLAYQERLGQELARRNQELTLLRELARSLARRPDLEQTMELVLGNLQLLGQARSAVFFEPDEEGLRPAFYRSPEESLLREAPLLKLREPMVEQAWHDLRVVSDPGPPGARMLAMEPAAVAIPLEELGVFYVGDSRSQPFTREEAQVLATTVAQAGLALLSAERFETQEQALQRHSRARQRLRGRVEQLGHLLEASRAVAGSLDPGAVTGAILAEASRLAPYDHYRLELGDRVVGESGPAWVETAALVRENDRPLLLESTRETRFAPLGVESLLGVPLAPEGSLLLGHSDPGQFDRGHQDLMLVLAVQVGTALENARLHAEVVEAYRLLQESQAQLVQASKIAAVGQLAAGVAHELNTPLGAVVLGIDSVLSGPDVTERIQGRLQRARNAALRAREIVNKLLFYTREGRSEERPVELSQVVEDTLEFLGYHLTRDNIKVERRCAPAQVLGNQHDLQQVLTNLILNARDALIDLPESQRLVEVSLSVQDREAVLEVVDRGPGIPPDVLERVFEPFFTTKPVGRGTGLGLSISHQIVEQHGGTLKVVSEPGQGARFVLRLPLLTAGE
ncbi:MAG: hypothetical protein AMXMBFR33_25240 [Candidatus Xenobia bacterium]